MENLKKEIPILEKLLKLTKKYKLLYLDDE